MTTIQVCSKMLLSRSSPCLDHQLWGQGQEPPFSAYSAPSPASHVFTPGPLLRSIFPLQPFLNVPRRSECVPLSTVFKSPKWMTPQAFQPWLSMIYLMHILVWQPNYKNEEVLKMTQVWRRVEAWHLTVSGLPHPALLVKPAHSWQSISNIISSGKPFQTLLEFKDNKYFLSRSAS